MASGGARGAGRGRGCWEGPGVVTGARCPHRECTRGGFCNFMHLKPISRELRRELYGRRRKK